MRLYTSGVRETEMCGEERGACVGAMFQQISPRQACQTRIDAIAAVPFRVVDLKGLMHDISTEDPRLPGRV